MRFLKWRIVKYKPLPKTERKLPLEKFHTFASGETVYTYRPGDLALISGRYLDKVKADINFLMEYGASRKQVEIYEEKAGQIINDGLNGKLPQGEALAKLKQQFDERKTLYKYNQDLNEQLWLDLYCMFFVLDTEDELKFSPAENDKKITLLKQAPAEVRELFFSYLEGLMTYFSDTLNRDIQSYIINQTKAQNLVEYLDSKISPTNPKSPTPSSLDLMSMLTEINQSRHSTKS